MHSKRSALLLLLLCAAILYTANAGTLSLLSLDDCFYARKGVELGRSGRFFTVTWNYQPTFQNPPLQFWILGRCFQWFGENDFSARLPSILMALGILALTYRIGRILFGERVGLLAASALLLTPQFDSNARRCMLEVPTTFWITACFWILLEKVVRSGSQDETPARPWQPLLLAIPLGAALLTKSLLGLLPLAVFGAFCFLHAPARDSLRKPWLWLGIAGGFAIGVTWPIHEYMFFGSDALRAHYFGEIAAKSAGPLPFWKHFFGYPLILLGSFQPLVLPALAGLIVLWKQRKEAPGMIVVWAVMPILIYSFSGAQSSRYVFPILPALALCAGVAVERFAANASTILSHWITPAVMIVAAAVLWVHPEWIVKDENKTFKQGAAVFHSIHEAEPLTYLGSRYWNRANPLLYYAERLLETPSFNAGEALSRAKQRESGLLLCDRDQFGKVQQAHAQLIIRLQDSEWVLISAKN